MSGHIIVQRRSGAAQVANLRSALVKKSQFEKMSHSWRGWLRGIRREWRKRRPSCGEQESVEAIRNLRVMPSGKSRLKLASNVVI